MQTGLKTLSLSRSAVFLEVGLVSEMRGTSMRNLKFGRAQPFHLDTCKNYSQPVWDGYQNMSKIGFYRTEYQYVQRFSSASGADALTDCLGSGRTCNWRTVVGTTGLLKCSILLQWGVLLYCTGLLATKFEKRQHIGTRHRSGTDPSTEIRDRLDDLGFVQACLWWWCN
jgi:hypothetical protein